MKKKYQGSQRYDHFQFHLTPDKIDLPDLEQDQQAEDHEPETKDDRSHETNVRKKRCRLRGAMS